MRSGRKTEIKAVKSLEKQGWKCIKPVRVRWQPEDFFGLFDIIAVKKGKVRFIQVSAKYVTGRTREWQDRWMAWKHHSKEFWRYDKKKKKFFKNTFEI